MTQAGCSQDLVLPHFLLVGAMKSGTCSLRDHLAQHPDISFSKGISYYFSKDDKWKRGPAWYARFFEHARGVRFVGESAPAYSYHLGKIVSVPERIVSLLPEVKILWILRNPIDRAYSHFWFYVSRGLELRSFARALEENRTRGVEMHRDYQWRGAYVEQIALYLRYFRREQMHIMLLNDLRTDADAAIKRVFAFLGVDPDATAVQERVRRNETFRPWSPRLQWLIRKAVFDRDGRLFKRLVRLVSRREPGYPPMDREVRAELARFYAPYNRALADLTGLDLSHWDVLPAAGVA